MARLQSRLLEQLPHVAPDTETHETFIARYGEEIGRSCWEEFAQKRIDKTEADRSEPARSIAIAPQSKPAHQFGFALAGTARISSPCSRGTDHTRRDLPAGRFLQQGAAGVSRHPQPIHLSRSRRRLRTVGRARSVKSSRLTLPAGIAAIGQHDGAGDAGLRHPRPGTARPRRFRPAGRRGPSASSRARSCTSPGSP